LISRIFHRIYSDFLLPDRLPLYRELLQRFLDGGVQLLSVVEYWDRVSEGRCKPEGRFLILRHDIDTDVDTARAMWDVETSLGVTSSSYFRLSTIAPKLMREMHAQGSEPSYHYEEIATFAKLRRLKTVSEVERNLPEIKARFRDNLLELRDKTGLPMRTVAAHGDFVNRALGYPNWKLLEDIDMRAELKIELEVYDRALESLIDARHSDTLCRCHACKG